MQLSAKTDLTSHRNRGSKRRLEETHNVRCPGPPRVSALACWFTAPAMFLPGFLPIAPSYGWRRRWERYPRPVGTLTPLGSSPSRQRPGQLTPGVVCHPQGSVSSPGPCSRKTCKKVLNSDFFWKSRTYGEKKIEFMNIVSLSRERGLSA